MGGDAQAVQLREDARAHRRQAHRHVREHVVGGQGRAPVRLRDGGQHHAERSPRDGAEGGTGQQGRGEHRGQADQVQAGQGQCHGRGDGGAAEEGGGEGAQGACDPDRHGRRQAQGEEDRAARRLRGFRSHEVDESRAEGGIEAAERPDRDDASTADEEGPAGGRGDGGARAQRAPRSGVGAGRLGREGDGCGLQEEDDHQGEVHGDGRSGDVVDEQGGRQDSGRHAGRGRDAVGEGGAGGASRWVEVDEGGAGRAGRGAGRESLQYAGRDEGVRAVGGREGRHRGRFQGERAEEDGAPSEVAGQGAGGEQRGQEGQGVGAEDHRHGQGRQPPSVLVDGVEGGGCAGGGQQRDQDAGVEGERQASPRR